MINILFSKMAAYALWWLISSYFIAFVMMEYIPNNKMLGPSDFVFKSIRDCDGVESVVKFGISQKKFNRTTNVLDIAVESANYEVGNNVIAELKGSMKKDGGFKPGAYYMKKPVCELLDKVVGDIADDIFEAAGIEGCPIPPGSYLAADFFFDNTKFNVPQVFGEYCMEINLYKDQVLQSCFLAYYDLVEKNE